MHQIVSPTVDFSRRWWVLATVVAAQFMFGVDAFIVNVAIPTIAGDLNASPAQIEAVIAVYLIAHATLVVTGGRLGDINGTRKVFLAGARDAGADGRVGRGARSAVTGIGIGDLRLRPGAGDGAIVRHGTCHGEAGKRRIGRRDVWHNFTDRQCNRRRGDRCYFFRHRSRLLGAAGAVCVINTVCTLDCHVCRISVVDAARNTQHRFTKSDAD